MMNNIAYACFGLVLLALMAACVRVIVWAVKCTDPWDYDYRWIFGGAAGAVLLLILGGVFSSLSDYREENSNPCIAWGSPRTDYVWVGKVMVPTTTTPCIRRQNETEK